MKISLRASAALVMATAAFFATACTETTKDFPVKKIEIVVGYELGGLNDVIARALAASMEEVSDANVLVVNRPGASGILATTEAMLAAPDGYNLLVAPISAFTNAPLMQEVHYSPEDFAGTATLSYQPFAIAVPTDSPIQTLEDLKSADGAGELTYSNMGTGHTTQVIMEQIFDDMGLKAELCRTTGPAGLCNRPSVTRQICR